MNGAVEFLKTLGPARLAAMAVVTALLVGFFGFIIMRATQPVMAPLYSDLSVQDSASIVKELEAGAVPYELRQDGAQILVPKETLLRLRMKLAEKGIPAGGSVGYEIFDKSDALGTTSFVQNINHLRALEGELARTIRAIDRVQAARVHLVIPERQLFQREKAMPSASIVLKLRGTLEAQQIRSIQHLVASAVEGLKPFRVSIVDEKGTLLGGGQEEDPQGTVAASLQERTAGYERRMETQIESIVGSIVGQGRARVRVSAELDFNRVTQTSDTFDPNGQVVRSTQTKEENSSSATGDKAVSVGNQLPGSQQQNGAAGRDATNSSEELVNYEISKTTRTEVLEAGRIKRISVAVLVDGVYAAGQNGEVTYQPRSQPDLDRISALVRSSVGFDQKRGDQVEVVNLRFAEAPASLPLEAQAKTGIMALIDFTKDDILRLIELGILFLMTILVLLFAVRPLIKRMVDPTAAQAAAGNGVAALGTTAALSGEPGSTVLQVTLPGHVIGADGKPVPVTAGTVGPDGQAAGVPLPENMNLQKLEQAKALGAMHATSIQKVGELIVEHPAEATALIRGWLMEG
ncbi:flagellar basal-body MS-ring/collar protein FliF [Prosthecomicrobium hirschii]|nr:flagellar basal-body MS-ring/collar protein FliF [Prosthecomicrobium hirschii]MCW1840750.1 flagellar basal-body MS-ring/collar protein FliF [Prosthecomicrobium hirschii]TPQ48631.1 flagellar M-ring protein FliF [Prosthecomicrobium hirschii]